MPEIYNFYVHVLYVFPKKTMFLNAEDSAIPSINS